MTISAGSRGISIITDDELVDIGDLPTTDGNIIVGNGTTWVAESGATARTSLGLTIGTDVQAYDAGLADIAGLAVTDGNIIVGDGANWVAESGATALTSLGAIGKTTEYISAGSMVSAITNGPLANQVETTTNKQNYATLDFDASTDEYAHFEIALPKSWDAGTVAFRAIWTTTATDTDGVAWALQGVAGSNDDAIDAQYGTAVVVTDDNTGVAEDLLKTEESAAVTIGGTPAKGDVLFFRVFRDVSDANDDMTEDARLIGIELYYTTEAGNDE